MAAAYRSLTTAVDSTFTVSSLAITKPAGVVDGDGLLTMVLVEVAAPTTAPTITTLAGWTLLDSHTLTFIGGAVNGRVALFRRVASSEPASNTWSMSGNCAITLREIASSGIDTATPIAVNTPTYNTGTSANCVATGATTLRNDVLLYTIVGSDASSVTFTPASGFNERDDSGGVEIASSLQSAAGASGNKTVVASGSGTFFAYLVGHYSLPDYAGATSPQTMQSWQSTSGGRR